MAKQSSLGELRDECARVKAAAEPDPEARHEEIRKSRFARKYRCADGAGEVRYRSTAEEVAEFWAVLHGCAERIFQAAHKEGRRESAEAYAADAMLSMARAVAGGSDGDGQSRPVPAKVIVRVDWDALVRGWPLDGETCEIPGVGPVPVSVVNAMIGSSAFLAVVLTRGADVVNVAHLGRRFTAAQVTGLEWKDPTCAVLGCNCGWRLEKDHRADWADTKVTMLAHADRLCGYHHDLKTRRGWRLVDGVGKRRMVPPEDPDHPRHKHPDPGPPEPGTIEYDLMRMAERIMAEQANGP
jgi:hypothetical protein